MSKSDCLLLIPAYNEENNVGEVLKEIRQAYPKLDVLVINDGSTDHTGLQVEVAGEKVITLPFNLGYGGALQTGFKYAESLNYRYIIQFDADGQHDPDDISMILQELRSGKADIIMGSRFLGRGSFKMGALKKAAIVFFRFFVKAFTGEAVSDPTSGLQGLNSRAYRYYATMGNFPEDFPDADTLINMILSGFRVKEIPANIRPRFSGTSMHYGLKTAVYMVKMLMSISVILVRKKLVKGV